MIDRSLPPVRRGYPNDFGETAEAFALCYLASYNSVTLSARTIQSYARSWGMNNIKLFPRVPGGRPGWIMVTYLDGGVTKIIVAIEGIVSFSQLEARFLTLGTAEQVDAMPGRVMTAYKTYANQIVATLLADPDYISAANRGNHTITFTGFSIGAAIAEVIAAKYQASAPTNGVTLKKFASPRVGNYNWVNGYDRRIQRASFYTAKDPMHAYPQTMFSRGLTPLATLAVYTFFVNDTIGFAWDDDNKGGVHCPEILQTIECNTVLAQLVTPIPMTRQLNRWWWHKMATYRWAIGNILYGFGADLNFYRFVYLENPDENRWGPSFLPGADWDDTWLALGGDPADRAVPNSFREREGALAANYVGDTDTNAGGGGDDDSLGEYSMPGWGVKPPNAPRIRRRVNQ